MTTMSTIWKDFDKFGVGFDSVFDQLNEFQSELRSSNSSYPPYNIRKIDDTNYAIELAVAGFSEEQLDIQTNDGKLFIKGDNGDNKEDDTFVFKGIANRAFTRTFALNEQVEVKDATLANGMLTILLEKIIPEESHIKKIAVRTAEPQLLTE